MERISSSLLGSIRHQLYLEHIDVIDEDMTDVAYIFILKDASLMYWQLDNIRRIAPINICTLYYEGNKHLAITIFRDA